jgi:undecaprenyl-diphosphatase
MGYFESILLGLVQGFTEFLPVSSSGHLLVLQYFFGFRNAVQNITFDLFLHLATLIAVVWVYRKDLKGIFTSKTIGGNPENLAPIPKWRFIGFIAITILVTGIALPFKDQLETLFSNINGVRISFLINAVALGILPFLRKGSYGLGKLTWIGAALIGLAQAISVMPGISRSGSTILAGLLLGLAPSEACRYSFLLSIPTIVIAVLVQIPDVISGGFTFSPGPMLTGFIFAFAAGLVAIPLLVGLVEKGKLWGFAIYCAVLGLVLFIPFKV